MTVTGRQFVACKPSMIKKCWMSSCSSYRLSIYPITVTVLGMMCDQHASEARERVDARSLGDRDLKEYIRQSDAMILAALPKKTQEALRALI